MLQNKNDLEACKTSKEGTGRLFNELKKENMELENELQSPKFKNWNRLVTLKKNISNLKKHIKDLEEGYRNVVTNGHEAERQIQELKETVEDQKQENRDLIVNLENLDKEKKDLENKLRLHELKDAKESSDVLRKQVQELQIEYSELNRRLEESNKENSSLRKENKKMENSLKEKLAEEKKMNARFQQYAEKFEEIPALKRHMDKVQSENTELNLKRRSPQVVSESKSCQNCFKYRNDISDLKREINDLRDRLSEAAGNKLRDNNPNIADLSDMNRPTSLAEKFSSLYTDEYTDAMEVIEDDMDEAASKCYEWCQRLAKEQRETLINRSIGFMENHGGQNVVLSDRCLIFVKEFQKKIAVESLEVVGQICHVKSVTQQTLSREKYIVKYIKKCSELCWMMQISDPPLYLNFDVNSGENLNKNDYNVFTKSGSKIDYLVWPVLYLHKTGPMLAKGVAQGNNL
ncbi:unnamed protein product [Mytilus edulis]|uniref:Mitochondria-eating protein C-terminal domain-containing protein n=1 Tax=Mytilus edulis TaxID=6550 RepID=A0A8S3SU53_MYTED|nr:unnamed protein product [Mytilus edulis]